MADAPSAEALEAFKQAAAIVTRSRKASVSYLQRQMSIGYNSAVILIDALEVAGVVSKPDHAGKREVLEPASDARGVGSPQLINEPEAPDADAASDASPDVLTATAQGRLRTIIERLERLEEDKQAVMTDMKEVFAEAKGEGYDVKVLRKVIRIRKQDKAKRQEEEAILDLYLSALGEV